MMLLLLHQMDLSMWINFHFTPGRPGLLPKLIWDWIQPTMMTRMSSYGKWMNISASVSQDFTEQTKLFCWDRLESVGLFSLYPRVSSEWPNVGWRFSVYCNTWSHLTFLETIFHINFPGCRPAASYFYHSLRVTVNVLLFLLLQVPDGSRGRQRREEENGR